MIHVNKSENLMVSNCDHGPIEYGYYSPGKNYNKYVSGYSLEYLFVRHPSPVGHSIFERRKMLY